MSFILTGNHDNRKERFGDLQLEQVGTASLTPASESDLLRTQVLKIDTNLNGNTGLGKLYPNALSPLHLLVLQVQCN